MLHFFESIVEFQASDPACSSVEKMAWEKEYESLKTFLTGEKEKADGFFGFSGACAGNDPFIALEAKIKRFDLAPLILGRKIEGRDGSFISCMLWLSGLRLKNPLTREAVNPVDNMIFFRGIAVCLNELVLNPSQFKNKEEVEKYIGIVIGHICLYLETKVPKRERKSFCFSPYFKRLTGINKLLIKYKPSIVRWWEAVTEERFLIKNDDRIRKWADSLKAGVIEAFNHPHAGGGGDSGTEMIPMQPNGVVQKDEENECEIAMRNFNNLFNPFDPYFPSFAEGKGNGISLASLCEMGRNAAKESHRQLIRSAVVALVRQSLNILIFLFKIDRVWSMEGYLAKIKQIFGNDGSADFENLRIGLRSIYNAFEPKLGPVQPRDYWPGILEKGITEEVSYWERMICSPKKEMRVSIPQENNTSPLNGTPPAIRTPQASWVAGAPRPISCRTPLPLKWLEESMVCQTTVGVVYSQGLQNETGQLGQALNELMKLVNWRLLPNVCPANVCPENVCPEVVVGDSGFSFLSLTSERPWKKQALDGLEEEEQLSPRVFKG